MSFEENETSELKRSTSELKEAIISIGAILNKHGKGMVYFGIEDHGRIIGQQVGKSTVKDIYRAIADHIDPKITFLDIQSFHGNLFELIEKSEAYVKEHINWRADLSGSRRIEIPEIPVRAVKEAIINSLWHRDFTNPKSNEIAIYRDRIEIFNPGQFPYEYEPEDFVQGNLPSVPRNPLIAEVLYLSEDIEKWGSGLRRIMQECRAAGIKVEFRKIISGFIVTFYRPGFATMPLSVKKSEGLNEGLKSLLMAIRDNPGIKAKDLSPRLDGRPIKTIERQIKTLVENYLIERKGSRKTGGYYRVRKKA